jgi:beta-lactamase regulating signal transducer with metallopeptidase domain
MTNSIVAADSYFPIVFRTSILAAVFRISAIIWLIVTCALLITMLLLYYFTKTEIKDASHLQDNIYSSNRITAPAIYGILHPRIIVPPGLPDADLSYVLLHEKAHIDRKDNLLRGLALLTACLHWFNPLAWVMLKYFLADAEMACDARVLKTIGQGAQKAYALALINCATVNSLFISAFGGAKIKVRIGNILSYKKLTAASGICFGLLLAVIFIVLLTNAQV